MVQAEVNVRTVSGLDSDELRALADWLATADELRGRVSLFGRVTENHHMGGVVEAVTIAVGGGGAATVLVQSLFAWLSQRRKGATLRLDMTKADGQETHLELDGIRNPDQVVSQVLEFLNENNDTPGG